MDALDRWITSTPYDYEEETDHVEDWKGEYRRLGSTYVKIYDEWIHEDDVRDYIKENCEVVVVGEEE